jgi:hypothetical protein
MSLINGLCVHECSDFLDSVVLSSAQFVFYIWTQPEGDMKFRVQLVIESNDDKPGVVEEIGVFERGQQLGVKLGSGDYPACAVPSS